MLLQIKGLQKSTLIDYPKKIACIVFLGGCNFKCGFCHNKNLVLDYDKTETIPQEEFFSFLDSRKGKLDGVVICGGEPCLSEGLFDFVKKIKSKGFSIKLDTNGSFPDVLRLLIESKMIDYVAMDIKYPFDRYEEFKNKVKESVNLIINSKIDHEFRTTVVPNTLSKDDLLNIASHLQGAEKYYLQQFRNKTCLNKEFENIEPFSKDKLEEFARKCSMYVKTSVRG